MDKIGVLFLIIGTLENSKIRKFEISKSRNFEKTSNF